MFMFTRRWPVAFIFVLSNYDQGQSHLVMQYGAQTSSYALTFWAEAEPLGVSYKKVK